MKMVSNAMTTSNNQPEAAATVPQQCRSSAVQAAPMAYGLGIMATCSQRCSRCLARVAGALTTAFAAVDQEPLPYNKTYEEQVMSCDVAVQMMRQWWHCLQ